MSYYDDVINEEHNMYKCIKKTIYVSNIPDLIYVTMHGLKFKILKK